MYFCVVIVVFESVKTILTKKMAIFTKVIAVFLNNLGGRRGTETIEARTGPLLYTANMTSHVSTSGSNAGQSVVYQKRASKINMF